MFRRLTQAYWPQRRSLIVLGILNVVSTGAEVLSLLAIAPLLQAAAEGADSYDGGLGPIEVDISLTQLAAIAAVLLVAALVVQVIVLWVAARLIANYRLTARLGIVDAFQRAEWSVQAQEREGWLRTLSTDFVNESAYGLRSIASWMKALIGLLVFLVGALLVNAVAVVVISVLMGLLALFLRPINSYSKRLAADTATYNVQTSEELATLTTTSRELKLFGVVAEASRKFRDLSTAERTVREKTEVVMGVTSPVFRAVGLLLLVGLIAVTAQRRDVEIAAIGLVVVLLYRSFNYGTNLVTVHQSLVRLVPVIDQLQDGIAKLEGAESHPRASAPAEVTSIEMRDVSFRYPGADGDALQGVNLSLDVGEVVGVVGPSGAGKSTLAEVLIGLRRPTSGEVRIGDVIVTDLDEESRARIISLVSQSVPLVPASVRDNVRFFRPIDDVRVDQAIATAGLAETVQAMPAQGDTPVGPGSRAMSGGQAQRIGIARAIAGDPKIIVLDEPTSALDATSEAFITDAIGELRGIVGVIVIAHRLSTLRHCDRIVVMEAGQVSDIGSMSELEPRNDFLRHAIAVGQLDWT